MSIRPIKMPYPGKLGASVILCFILLAGLILCGFDFGTKKVAMDTEERIVYQIIGADELSELLRKDKSAKVLYEDKYYAAYGVIESIKADGRELVLKGIADTGSKGITCKAGDDAVIDMVRKIKAGDTVLLYGKVSAGLVVNAPSIKILSLEGAEDSSFSKDMYAIPGEKIVKRSALKKRELNDGEISYYIPQSWEAVEHDIKKEGLGNIEGRQYCLNKLDKGKAYAESFFVCYFDKSKVDINDRGDNELIEEAIIRDIMSSDNIKSFPFKKCKTYYGTEYKYYRDIYRTKTAEKYSLEMIFQETDGGMLMYVYVYRDDGNRGNKGKKSSLDDIMVTLRLIGQ